MKAQDYNKVQHTSGILTWGKITELVKFWQYHHNLYVDGKFGKITDNSFVKTPSPNAIKLVDIARKELGKGESDGWNNSGKDIYKYRRLKYTGKQLIGEWCAYFVSWCYSEALNDHIVCGGAKKFGKILVNEKGAQEVNKECGLIFGDIVIWDRGVKGSWEGHIGIVSSSSKDGKFKCIEGNRGPYPAKVGVYTRYLKNERIESVIRI